MLRTLVRDEKANILISGGTGAGKTSLLNALIAEIPAEERLGIIEDTRDIQAAAPSPDFSSKHAGTNPL
jgi:Flp pilus assembly CpaF family ATPase